MQGWHDRIPYRTGGFEYGYNYIMKQKSDKQYGSQKSVADLNIHVSVGEFMVCWVETEPEKPQL